MTIIEGLMAEHRVFLGLFSQIEAALPQVNTTEEIGLLCRLLEGMLHTHGSEEIDLAYIAVDHILNDQGRLNRLYHDHHELDENLRELAKVRDLPKARAQLKTILNACRAHFDEEERTLFPLIEEALQHETLEVLGRARKSRPCWPQLPVTRAS